MATPAILGPDGRPTPASTFLVVHRALRRDLARFPAAIRGLTLEERVDGDRVAALQQHWKSYRDILDAHHEQEDKVLFPELRDLAPGLSDLLDVLDTKHADLTGLLDTVSSWVEQLPEETDLAIAALDELAEFLVFHLDTEEAHLVPVMLSSLEPPGPPEPGPLPEGEAPAGDPPEGSLGEEQAGEVPPDGEDEPEPGNEGHQADRAGGDFGAVPPSFALPWCADGLDDQVVQVLLAGLPEPLRAEYPAWNDGYQQTLARWA